MNEYVTFQSFYSEEDAAVFVDLFSKNGIDTKIVRVNPIIDQIIIGNDPDNKVYLKIKDSDFNQANKILEENMNENISRIDHDHYLYSFSNDELFEILNNQDDWSKQDYFIAKQILTKRGVNFSEKDISQNLNHIIELGKQEKASLTWIIIGYLFSSTGVFGLIFSLAYLSAKKILPDGSKVFVYDNGTRIHGRNMLIISCMFIIINILTALNIAGVIF